MFLKSLELNGFKSFAQKTVLEFPKGVTTIVGPNGSGKSNLIDSIRWLLGEREAKNLRSAKAEDLIFNGTPTRPRVALASAGLFFDNSSGFFPVDFKEISAVRKVDRDGASQYFLNKIEVKLKDIIDFFSRSRLGARGLTIINQGEADLFVKASIEERKAMIEEILGLKEYQLKKSEAERKLKNTFLNLEKTKAMIGEAAPRLRILKRQTAKWEKRAEIQKELEGLEHQYFSYKFNEIESGRLEIEPNLNSLKKQIQEKEKELNVLELDLKKIESFLRESPEIKEIKNSKQPLLEERFRIYKELGRLEAKLEFLTVAGRDEKHFFNQEEALGLIKEIKEILEQGLGQLNFEDLKKIAGKLIAKINLFLTPDKNNQIKTRESVDLENIKNNLETRLGVLEKELAKLEEKETEFTADLEGFNKNFQKAFELMEAKKEEIRELENAENKINFEKEKLNLKRQDLEEQLVQIGRSISEFQSTGFSRQYMADGGIGFDILKSEKRMLRLRAELAVIGEIDESLIKEAKETEAHYNFLTGQSADLEGAMADLKNLIKELSGKIRFEFNNSLKLINEEFNKFFKLMFGGGNVKLKVKREERKRENSIEDSENNNENNESEISTGVEIDLNLPKKRINSLETLSGGEKSLVSIAALFALISVSPPPFLVLDEIDAALDENNSRRFANLIKEFSRKIQFIVVTHNRPVMEAANVLYGVTTDKDGTSKILSLRLDS